MTEHQEQELREEIERDKAEIERLWSHPVVDLGPILRLQERIAHHERELGIDQE